MKNRSWVALLMSVAGGLWVAANAAPEAPLVPYPEGFRGWAHVKSKIKRGEGKAVDPFGEIHHIYANPPAMEGYRTGKFPEGAVLVFDVLELVEKDSKIIREGARRNTQVMVKDARFVGTGGWGYELFAQDSRENRAIGANAVTACYQCHTQRKDHDHVFSSFRP